ncbi:MAG TPA: nuclear transport factor 2 family protein [Pyrinomonadaceae bacterium]|jgi:ketosteroid isomerase-like protein
MNRTLPLIFLLTVTTLTVAGQNTNSSTTTPTRTQTPNTNRSTPPPPPKPTGTGARPKSTPTPTPTPKPVPKSTPAPVPGSEAVVAAFNHLIDGIQTANVEKVMSVYWNSPALTLFNYNGTVTKGWEQVRQNRLSSYPEIKNAKLDVRDLSVTMLGRDGAVVNCLWTQSQVYKGTPETASGRMTLVFKRLGNSWKAIHLHTSPDSPNPASVPPSEQQPSPSPKPSPTP